MNKIKLSLANLTCPSCGITLLLQHDPLTLISSSGIATSGRDKEEVEKELEEIKKNIEYLQKTVIEDSKKLEKKNVLQNKLDTVKKFFEGYGIQKSNLKQIEEAIQRNNSSFTTLNKNLDILQDMESRLRNDHLSSAIMNMRKDLAKKSKEREAIGEKENCNETSGIY